MDGFLNFFTQINWGFVILFAIIGLGLGLWLSNRRMARNNAVALNEEEFTASMRKGQLIDLRSSAEYEKGHINGARNLPAPTIMKNHGKLRKDLPVYMYDAKGKNTTLVNFLVSKGITEIYYLQGGLENFSGSLRTKKK